MSCVLCIGQAVQDFVFSVPAIPTTADKYRARRFVSLGGGPAATAAVAIARLGGRALLAARLGDDAIGDLILAELEREGVDCSLMRRFDAHTSSLSAVFVDDDGERLIVNYLDESMPTGADWLPDALPADVGTVLVDTRWPEGALPGLVLARQAGIPGILDGDRPVPADGALVRAATHTAFSRAGLVDYAGNDDVRAALATVAAETDAWCCVTLGAAGTLYVDDAHIREYPAFHVSVGDTLGAGDVWHGAFALSLASGSSLQRALTFAAGAAALKVEHGGGRDGAPTRRELDDFLGRYETGSFT